MVLCHFIITTQNENIHNIIGSSKRPYKTGLYSQFQHKNDCIECIENNLQLQPNEFEIDETHRFQEMSDVDNESILYAISSTKNNLKGLLVNAYSIYADSASAALIRKLSFTR